MHSNTDRITSGGVIFVCSLLSYFVFQSSFMQQQPTLLQMRVGCHGAEIILVVGTKLLLPNEPVP